MVRRYLAILALAVGLVLCAAGAASAQQSKGLKDNLALGNPSGASKDPKKTPNNFLMDKELFALSYNSSTGTPNWVSWRLVKDDISDIERKDDFHPDEELMGTGLVQVFPKEYDHGGFDQGHMCPNGDRDVDRESANKTFVMTNMVPQSAALNEQSWRLLEDHCQKLAGAGKELYIVAGPFGSGGHGVVKKRDKTKDNPLTKEKGKVTEITNVFKTAIGDRDRITVPAQCWKVVVILDHDPATKKTPAQRVTKDTPVIAVVMANDMTPKKWQDHQVSVAEVEKLTKFKFFLEVEKSVGDALRKRPPAQARNFDAPAPALAYRFADVLRFAATERLSLLR